MIPKASATTRSGRFMKIEKATCGLGLPVAGSINLSRVESKGPIEREKDSSVTKTRRITPKASATTLSDRFMKMPWASCGFAPGVEGSINSIERKKNSSATRTRPIIPKALVTTMFGRFSKMPEAACGLGLTVD